jgi:hypothetical protein
MDCDRTPNAAAHRNERESGSNQSQFDSGMSRGNRRHPLADRQLHRKWEIPSFRHYILKVEPGLGSQCQRVARRTTGLESRTHCANQTGTGKKTEAEKIKRFFFAGRNSGDSLSLML